MDAPSKSRYHEIYARWQRDPQGFWARGRAGDRLDRAGRNRCSIRAMGVYGRWFAGAVCNTCWNAVDRHVHARARRRRPAIIYDSPLGGQEAHHHL